MTTPGTHSPQWQPATVLEVQESLTPSGCAVCQPAGELDAFTAGRLRRSLAGLASPKGTVLDLSHVTFVDSAGLGAIVGGIRRTRDLGGATVVVCARSSLVRLLEMTGVDRLAPVVATVPEAAAVLAAPPAEPDAHRPPSSRAPLLG